MNRILQIENVLSLKGIPKTKESISNFINDYLDKNDLLMYSLRNKISGERRCFFELDFFGRSRICRVIEWDITEKTKRIMEKRTFWDLRISDINAIYNEGKDIWSNEHGISSHTNYNMRKKWIE